MAKRGRGNIKQFTEEERRIIESMGAVGIPQADIAKVMRCDPKTLQKHCRDELDQGMIKANARVGRYLYEQATKNLTAAIFWAKTRMQWRETNRYEVTGKDGESFQPILNITIEK